MQNKPIRGFNHLINERVVKVDSTALNAVVFETESGKRLVVDCDEQQYGIGVIRCNEDDGSWGFK